MFGGLPDPSHSAGRGGGTATLKFYEGRDILSPSAWPLLPAATRSSSWPLRGWFWSIAARPASTRFSLPQAARRSHRWRRAQRRPLRRVMWVDLCLAEIGKGGVREGGGR